MFNPRLIVLAVGVSIFSGWLAEAAEPLDIGLRRELFVDDYLIDELSGDAQQVLHVGEQSLHGGSLSSVAGQA